MRHLTKACNCRYSINIIPGQDGFSSVAGPCIFRVAFLYHQGGSAQWARWQTSSRGLRSCIQRHSPNDARACQNQSQRQRALSLHLSECQKRLYGATACRHIMYHYKWDIVPPKGKRPDEAVNTLCQLPTRHRSVGIYKQKRWYNETSYRANLTVKR